MKQIPLGNNLFALVDDADYALAAGHKWHAHRAAGTWVAIRRPWVDGRKEAILLHHLIIGMTPDTVVLFKDGNGLNCTRANLTVETRAVLAARMGHAGLDRKKGTGSLPCGVFRAGKSYGFGVKLRGKYLGYFPTAEAAQAARDQVLNSERLGK